VNGAIINKQSSSSIKGAVFGMMEPLNQVEWAKNEVSVFQKLLEVFREYDPDILVGFETETQSIGYICKRGEALTI
jgi:DNA polymerase elongation subunit (family B)